MPGSEVRLSKFQKGSPCIPTNDQVDSGQTRSLQLLCCADFFHAAIHTPLYTVLAVMAVIYIATFFFFGLLWWGILR